MLNIVWAKAELLMFVFNSSVRELHHFVTLGWSISKHRQTVHLLIDFQDFRVVLHEKSHWISTGNVHSVSNKKCPCLGPLKKLMYGPKSPLKIKDTPWCTAYQKYSSIDLIYKLLDVGYFRWDHKHLWGPLKISDYWPPLKFVLIWNTECTPPGSAQMPLTACDHMFWLTIF